MMYKDNEKRDVTIYISRKSNLPDLSDKEYERVMDILFDLDEDDLTQMFLDDIHKSSSWKDEEDE